MSSSWAASWPPPRRGRAIPGPSPCWTATWSTPSPYPAAMSTSPAACWPWRRTKRRWRACWRTRSATSPPGIRRSARPGRPSPASWPPGSGWCSATTRWRSLPGWAAPRWSPAIRANRSWSPTSSVSRRCAAPATIPSPWRPSWRPCAATASMRACAPATRARAASTSSPAIRQPRNACNAPPSSPAPFRRAAPVRAILTWRRSTAWSMATARRTAMSATGPSPTRSWAWPSPCRRAIPC